MPSNNFYDYYNNIICPKLRALDILSKGNYSNIDIDSIINLLDISEKEINYILEQKNIDNISSDTIHILMLNGSSYICKIFRRTINTGCPSDYTVEDIAYIYGLEPKRVDSIFKKLHTHSVPDNELNNVFRQIKL